MFFFCIYLSLELLIFRLALPSLAFVCRDCIGLQYPHYRQYVNAPDGIQPF